MKLTAAAAVENPAIAAHQRLEESVGKVCMLLDMLGDRVALDIEQPEVEHSGLLASGLLGMVHDAKTNLLNDWESARAEWAVQSKLGEVAA